jgi:predicted phosphodiesterase
MRFAVISDIHSNLEALEVALSKIKIIGYDEIICLGDIIGYGPNPNECFEIISDLTDKIICGNHEEAVLFPSYLNRMSDFAKESMTWTIQQLKRKFIEYITKMDKRIEFADMLFVHANPSMSDYWDYIYNANDAERYFPFFHKKICFVGHSHIANTYKEELLAKDREPKWIINVGSVGQPRDKNSSLSFGVFDTDKWEYKNYRFDYDFKITAQKIEDAGLPRFLGDRLSLGI